MRSLFLLFVTLFIGAACNTKTATTSSGSISATAPFVWETAFPKDILVSVAFSTPDEQTKITAMMTAWETGAAGYDFFREVSPGTEPERTDTITGPNQLRDGKFAIYKATQWPYPEFPDALAITQIFAIRYNRGESSEYVAIQEADVIMNYEDFLFDDASPMAFDYDFQTVLLHELGHFLGLQHKPRSYNRNNTVMYPSIYSQSLEVKQVPQLIDRQDLASKYSITLPPLTAGGSAIATSPRTYTRNPSDAGEMTKIVLELRANGECVHHADGVEFTRHQMNK
ncbi:MAG: matrixin family metalloprotease [Bdellovibrionota bacterium]